MKNIERHLKELRERGLIFHTHEEVFGKLKDQSKEYQREYKKEIARLTLIRQIREFRLAKKLTQKTVAKRAHMPQSVVARLESGEHSFSLDTLQRIASVFDKQVQLV